MLVSFCAVLFDQGRQWNGDLLFFIVSPVLNVIVDCHSYWSAFNPYLDSPSPNGRASLARPPPGRARLARPFGAGLSR